LATGDAMAGRRFLHSVATLIIGGAYAATGLAPAWATSPSPVHPVHTDFNPAAFPEAPKVDNRWLPLTPGTQFVFSGQASQGGAPLPHQVIFTVTDLTKVINGVRTVVLWDRDISEGEVVEAELAFHAQDNSGTVWNLGEYPEEFEGGAFAGAPNTWLAGVGDSQAGIAMRANPTPGTPPYLQGFAPSIGFEDQGTVETVGQQVCVPVGCYNDVVVIDETNLRAPAEGHQLKLHAPGVGVVRIDPGLASQDLESLVLTEIRQLGPKEMARVRAVALRLDRRVYRFATDIYRDSPRASRFPPVPTDIPAGL
jgi:hypothetical protein